MKAAAHQLNWRSTTMTNQLSYPHSAETAKLEAKLLDCLLFFFCVVLLVSYSLGIYSLYRLLQFFISTLPTPFNTFGALQ
jgi:hypothetical protein